MTTDKAEYLRSQIQANVARFLERTTRMGAAASDMQLHIHQADDLDRGLAKPGNPHQDIDDDIVSTMTLTVTVTSTVSAAALIAQQAEAAEAAKATQEEQAPPEQAASSEHVN